MAFCTACSVDGVQTCEHGHTRRGDLDGVESAPGSTCATGGSQRRITSSVTQQNQIVAALNDAGRTGAASMPKMKKGDAASHAEQWLSGPGMGAGMV